MQKLMRKSLLLIPVALVCFHAGAFADVTMQLMAPPPGPSMAGIFINPYTALVTPAGGSGVLTRVICDDFDSDISTSTPPWQATEMSVGALLALDMAAGATTGSSLVKFDATASALTQAIDYVAAAYLAKQIFDAELGGLTTLQGELSYALWGVFSGNALPYLHDNAFDGGGPTAAAVAQSYKDAAIAWASQTDAGGHYVHLDASLWENVVIYTPQQTGIQEFDAFRVLSSDVVTAPEPSSVALLGVYLAGLVGLIAICRRRLAAR
jgi:hypothetical protein